MAKNEKEREVRISKNEVGRAWGEIEKENENRELKLKTNMTPNIFSGKKN